MKPYPHPLSCVAIALLLAATDCLPALIEMPKQAIALPEGVALPLFVDLDAKGRRDLLVLDSGQKRLLVHRQHPDGFRAAPDQAVLLPDQTAWVAACDLDGRPGLELLASTANGFSCARQAAGRFDSKWSVLVEASQVFTNCDNVYLFSLPANKGTTNDILPLITADQAVAYRRTAANEWQPAPAVPLIFGQSDFNVSPSQWSIGAKRSRTLAAWQSFRSRPAVIQKQDPENDPARKIIEGLNKTGILVNQQRMDVNGDGREDLVLWQAVEKMDFKTDIYIFLRDAGGLLPERPSQTLHCNGFPIPLSNRGWSPIGNLDGGSACELVLMEPRTAFMAPNTLIEMVISKGVDMLLTVRTFQHGLFSRSPDVSIPITIVLDMDETRNWPFYIQGDFNGDGRPDLLVRRTITQWLVYFSAPGGRWFEPQPALTFDAPSRGWIETPELNGDGLADIVWHEQDEHRITVYLSTSTSVKGGKL